MKVESKGLEPHCDIEFEWGVGGEEKKNQQEWLNFIFTIKKTGYNFASEPTCFMELLIILFFNYFMLVNSIDLGVHLYQINLLTVDLECTSNGFC